MYGIPGLRLGARWHKTRCPSFLSEVIDSQQFDVARILQNQLLAGHPESRQGVFLTTQESTANFFAQVAAGPTQGRGLGPATLKIQVPAKDFSAFTQKFGIPVEQGMPHPPVAGMTETLLPFQSVSEFEAFAKFFLLK